MEKRRKDHPTARQDFNNSIEDCGLLDLRVEGGCWSWSNSSFTDSRIVGRLDRTIVNQEWINNFTISYDQYLSALTSDHSPMVVFVQKLISTRSKPFHFLNRWGSEEGFLNTVMEGWNLPIIADPIYCFVQKLKQVKKLLKAKAKD